MKLTKKELDYDMTHRHSGNGFAVVEILDEDFCRVTSIPFSANKGIQAFLAAGSQLTRTLMLSDPKNLDSPKVENRIAPDIADKLSTLRNDIESGKKKVVSSWIRTVVPT